MDQVRLITMQEKVMHQSHQAPGAESLDGILILDCEKFSSLPVSVRSKCNLGNLVSRLGKDI